MRKTYLIIALILGAVLTALLIVKKNYDQSPEYNYITAKLDIRKGNCRLVRVGAHTISAQEQAIEGVASKYGFKNVYIEKVSANERKGIDHYNETIEIYLSFRNGPDWKANYQHEVDSILKITVTLQYRFKILHPDSLHNSRRIDRHHQFKPEQAVEQVLFT